jgi:hypothetical protein
VAYVAQQPANIWLRSQCCAFTVRTKRISLEQLRKVFGLESVRDVARNIIREVPLYLICGYTRDAAMARNKASLHQMQSSAFFPFGVVIPISKSHADRLHDILIGFLNTFE